MPVDSLPLEIPFLQELTTGVTGRELCGIFSSHGECGQTVQPVHEPPFPGVITPRKRYPSDNNPLLSHCLTSSNEKNKIIGLLPALMEGGKGLLVFLQAETGERGMSRLGLDTEQVEASNP